MSELSETTETTGTQNGELASTAKSELPQHEDAIQGVDRVEYDRASAEARIAEEERLPSRQEAWRQTWEDTPEYYDDAELATLYDGDESSLAAEGQGLPTRQEAREQTWEDSPETQNSQSLAASAEADHSDGSPSAELDETGDTDVEIVPTEQVVVHDQYGHDVPLTVVHGAPDGPTLGNGTPEDIGLKPTGEELLDMESEAKSWKEAFRNEIHRESEEITDVAEKWGDLGARLCERPPTSTHTEVPTGQPVTSMPEHHGIEGGQVAIAAFTVALVGYEAYRKARDTVSAWRRGREHDSD
jgi:hypothetical protein